MHRASRRAVERIGHEAFERLVSMPGADLASLQMELAARRAERVGAVDVLRQYSRDAFVRPSSVDPRRLAELTVAAHGVMSPVFEFVELAPVVPFGTHAATADVSQHRVLSATRGLEVAADATNALALEAALRRSSMSVAEQRSPAPTRLAAVQRVLRAQRFADPRFSQHFALVGAVIAGRDTGARRFEREALVEMLESLVAVGRAIGAERQRIALTDFSATAGDVLDAVGPALRAADVDVEADPTRTAGTGYYPSVCFKLHVVVGDVETEVGDGGFVPWTQRLLGNAKERLLIGGVGLERLAVEGFRRARPQRRPVG